MNSDQNAANDIEALEARRCAATSAGDIATLEEIYAPEMSFVHFRGKTQSAKDYIGEVAVKPRGISVGPMKINVFGDFAIATGAHDITRPGANGESRVIKTFATRILRKADGVWRYIFIQVAPIEF